MSYSVYIVRCADDTYYTGIAKDVQARVQAHNTSPQGAKYTRARRPVILVYSEVCTDRSAAQKREYVIRHYSRTQKEQLSQQYTNKLSWK